MKAKRERFQCPKKVHSIEWTPTVSSGEDSKIKTKTVRFCTSKIFAIVCSLPKRCLYTGVVLLFPVHYPGTLLLEISVHYPGTLLLEISDKTLKNYLSAWLFNKLPFNPTINVLISKRERGNIFMALIYYSLLSYLEYILNYHYWHQKEIFFHQKTGNYYAVDEQW